MDQEQLKARTKKFALRVVKLCDHLADASKLSRRTIAAQLIRSGTSVGANYRASCRARSKAEFIAKMGTVEEEADESCFWLELIIEAGILKPDLVNGLLDEASELCAIASASRKTASTRQRSSEIGNRKSAIGNKKQGIVR